MEESSIYKENGTLLNAVNNLIKVMGSQQPIDCANIEASDADLLPFQAVALRVGTIPEEEDATLKAETIKGNDVTFTGIAEGEIIHGQFRRVYNTDTTVSDIVAYKINS